jgi:hypothetical protein
METTSMSVVDPEHLPYHLTRAHAFPREIDPSDPLSPWPCRAGRRARVKTLRK